MTETISPADTPAAETPHLARPHTDAAALRAIDEATKHLHERAVKIRQCPELHMPKLVLSEHVRGTSDRRAIADHETLIALHEMAKQQLDILNGQDRVLDILNNFASKDMPGRQAQIQNCVDQILAKVDAGPAAG
jgi:hypothetical protein